MSAKKQLKRKRFGTASVLALLFAFSLANVCAFAESTQDLEEVIQEKISERHPTDTPEWWRSLGPSAPQAIISLYEKTTGIYQRLRLVEALGWFDDAEGLAFLKKQTENPVPDVIRNGAIRAVGNSAGAKEIDFLSKFLDHSDPKTRTAAGQALKRINDPRATALLQKFYEKEQMPWVKSRVRETPTGTPVARGPLLKLESKTLPGLKFEFAGSWKGVLIVPLKGQPSVVKVDAQAKTQLKSPSTLSGEVLLQVPAASTDKNAAPRSMILQFAQAVGKDTHVQGMIQGEVLKEWGSKKGMVHFEGELQEQGDVRLLKMESRELLMTIVLRKSE